jgi:hypothetical protein
MALGTPTVNAEPRKAASAPLRLVSMDFAGDSAYASGGTADFAAYVAAAMGETAVSVAFVMPRVDFGDYEVLYDADADKLRVKANSTDTEVSGSQAGVTYKLWVLVY